MSGLQFTIDWLDRNRDRVHAADCRSREPNAQCSCGLHRVLSELRQLRNDLEATAAPSPQAGAQVEALATAIGDAAVKAGIVAAGTTLTGPQLVMLCDDLASAALSAIPAAGAQDDARHAAER